MAIAFPNYVNIQSGVGAGNNLRNRELIGRLFTDNPLVPTGANLEFTSADQVGIYFGYASQEYLRASFYFSRNSKNNSRASKISFAYFADVASAPLIYGAPSNKLLSQFTSITDGSFVVSMGSYTGIVTGLNFSAAGSLAAVAAIIQTAINAKTSGGALFTAATVTYDPIRKSFQLVGGVAGPAVITTAAGTTGTNIASLLGWLVGNSAILSNGSAIQTVTQTLANSASLSNNFGSFLFMPTLTEQQVIEGLTWNDTQNEAFQFMIPVLPVNAAQYASDLAGLAGGAISLVSPAPAVNEYPEMCPMIIMASTNYDKQNSVQNYMYQQFNLTPSVTNDADYAYYNNLRINFYGQTQEAGQLVNFYQRGVLTGLSSDPVDMNTYANEQWLKSAAGAAIMTLLLNLSRVSANTQGRAQILAILHPVITQALTNGTISVGKTLTPTQQAYISDQTGDDKAYFQIQNIGYWLDCSIVSFTNTNGVTEYKAVYALIYSKDDVIRIVQGTHTLI